DASGQLHFFDKLSLASVSAENTSLMPADYASRLSGSEIDDIVAYLVTLTSRDLSKRALAPTAPRGPTFERYRNSQAEPYNWLMYWGDYQGTHYSALKSID